MTIIGGPGLAGVSMISDDNFSATQFTRVLNLLVQLAVAQLAPSSASTARIAWPYLASLGARRR